MKRNTYTRLVLPFERRESRGARNIMDHAPASEAWEADQPKTDMPSEAFCLTEAPGESLDTLEALPGLW